MTAPGYLAGCRKLLARPDRLVALRSAACWPTHILVAPTANCQLRCRFCCLGNRPVGPEWTWDTSAIVLDGLMGHGVEAIEMTGGEPLLWPHFGRFVDAACDSGIAVGLVTNGLLLRDTPARLLSRLAWIRISLSALDHANRSVLLPEGIVDPRLSASYVWHAGSTRQTLRAVADWCREQGVVCRVVVDECAEDREELAGQAAAAIAPDADVLHFAHHPVAPVRECYIPWVKPYAAWDGWLYACGCFVTNERGKSLGDAWRVCRLTEMERFYSRPIAPMSVPCSRCAYAEHNALVTACRQAVDDPLFL